MPKDERRTGVILYLHGGGYTCGSLEYAKGFAAALASECGVRVFCAGLSPGPGASVSARRWTTRWRAINTCCRRAMQPGQIMLCRGVRRRRADLLLCA